MDIGSVIRQQKFTDTYQKCVINLFYTANFFRDSHLSVFKAYDIQGQHFNILRILRGKHPDAVTPGYIKDVMLDKGRDVTRLIDKLIAMGWVERQVCPQNRRKMDITITTAGLKITEEISEKLQDHDSGMQNLSDEEYQTLSHLLDKMRG